MMSNSPLTNAVAALLGKLFPVSRLTTDTRGGYDETGVSASASGSVSIQPGNYDEAMRYADAAMYDEGFKEEFDEDDERDYSDPDNPNSATYDNTRGCCFPDRCLMPGEHLRGECYDVAMAEAMDNEHLRAAERGCV